MNTLKQRNEVFAQMKQINDLSTRSESDIKKYDELEAQYNNLTAQIEREVRFDAIAKNMDSVLDKRTVSAGNVGNDEIRSAFIHYVRSGDVSEIRNINSFSSTEGGVNVPTVLMSTIVKAIADNSVMRRIGANIISTTSTTTLPLAITAPTALWKDQNPSASYAETAQGFNSATLGAYKLTGLVKISEEVLQDASTDLEGTVVSNLGVAFGNAEEIAFVSGSGAAGLQPLGLFRHTAAGGNNVLSQNLGSQSGSFLDNIVNAYYAMPGNRRQEAVWVVGDGLAKAMRQAKASTAGTYLWEVSTQAGQPDRFLGRPVFTTAALPTAWAAGAVIGGLVYPKHYYIGDRGGYTLTRLNELYAAEGNVGFKAMKRTDAVLVDGNSFVKLVSNVV